MSEGFRVQKLWAYLSVDPADNAEGIIGAKLGETWMPLIAANEERLTSLRGMLDDLMPALRRRGMTVRLASFELRTDVETIE